MPAKVDVITFANQKTHQSIYAYASYMIGIVRGAKTGILDLMRLYRFVIDI
jgi:hypothetical protein